MKKVQARYYYYAFIALCYAFLLDASWCRWGELVIDTFRDQLVAMKLLEGKVLYKDIYYLFGILPPYCLVFLNKLFGATLYCSVGLNLVLTTLCLAAVYRITRIYCGRTISSLSSVTFLFILAFNNYNGYGVLNFILPYTNATVFAMMFVVFALYFFLKYIMTERPVYLYGWVAAQFLTLMSRFDVTLPVYLLYIFWGAILFYKRKKLLKAAYLFLPAAASVAAYAVYLTAFKNYSGFESCVLQMFAHQSSGNDMFALYTSGVYSLIFANNTMKMEYTLIENLVTTAKLFTMQGMLIALSSFAVLGLQHKERESAAKPVWIPFIRFMFFASSAFVMYCLLAPFTAMHFQYYSVPLLLMAGFFGSWLCLGIDYKKYFSLMVLMSVSMAMLLRVLVKMVAFHYGVFYAIPGMIGCYLIAADIVPSLARRYFSITLEKRHTVPLIVIFAVLCNYQAVKNSLSNYNMKTMLFVSDRARIYTFEGSMERYFFDTVNYFKYNTPEDATVVPFPEGVGVNFLSNRKNPMKYEHYLPNILKTIGEEKIIKELEQEKIDYIVIYHRSCFEYGVTYFGIDFGETLYMWIMKNFEVVKQFGAYPGTCGIYDTGALIMKKRAPQANPVKGNGRFANKDGGIALPSDSMINNRQQKPAAFSNGVNRK